MNEKINNSLLWNAAGKTGLVFGLFSGACLTLKQLLAIHWDSVTGVAIAGIVLWAVEFFGCIWMMAFFMKKLCRDYAGVTSLDTYRYGRRIALLSALIFAAINLLLMLTVAKELTETALEEALAQYGSMLDANSREALDNLRGNLPALTFFSQFIYCWLYGTVLSSILSRTIPKPGMSDVPAEDEPWTEPE